MRNFVILSILVVCFLTSPLSADQDSHDCSDGAEKHVIRLDPFHEVLERANSSAADSLPLEKFNDFIHGLFENLKCGDVEDSHGVDDVSDEHHGCEEPMCINASSLVSFLGGDVGGLVSEDLFGNASQVLLYHIIHLDHYCHGHVNTTLTLDEIRESLLESMGAVPEASSTTSDHFKIPLEGISHSLEALEEHISHEHHDHHSDDDDDHHDDDDNGHDDDPHHDDDHRRRREAVHDDDHDGDDDDHHDDDDHEDDHDHNHSTSLVVEQKCLSSDGIFFYLGVDSGDYIDADRMDEVASLIVFLLAGGSHIEQSCRLLPKRTSFVENIFEQFSEDKKSIDIHALEALMTKMKIEPGTAESDEHDEHEGHDHDRRRRSADMEKMVPQRHGVTRSKRQTAPNPAVSKCYSASQLMALFDPSGSMDRSAFERMCPSLVSQSLYADCAVVHSDEHEEPPSDAEKYGYGTLSTAIICLCAAFGVVFIPCASTSVYNGVMALFMGLSVGTLFADAVLHLIPLAMGLHKHEHGHDHDTIEVEDHVRVGLAILGGLYLFYLLELIMSTCGDHSHEHSHELEAQPGVFSNAAFEDSEKPHNIENGDHKQSNGYAVVPEKKDNAVKPVAVMIIFGDALHNFADGLAIGAAFSDSNSTGIATSIAVFCHELPHELGDFAVLIKSGLSYKKALGLNLLSALTAFIGLYIGISISAQDNVQKWIFALAAGMFLYIALVDVLPLLIKSRSKACLFLNNIGILLGFGIMFIIALFEEHIKV